jgi:hypothetical protein
MTLDEFHGSLSVTEPPAGLTHVLAGLWWDGNPIDINPVRANQ